MKLKDIFQFKNIVILIFVIFFFIDWLKISNLNYQTYKDKKTNNKYLEEIQQLNDSIKVNHINIFKYQEQIKEKDNKIVKLNDKIIKIQKSYEKKYKDIDNYSSNQLHNELSRIFSENNIK